MLTYSLLIYDWSVSLTKALESYMRNFVWSGDICKRKSLTVTWHKVCRPFHQGGLGIRFVSCINVVTNLQLCLELFNSSSHWAQLLMLKDL
ncbi:unnamed protein product [Lathyrus sativus]|nr:unnamed protein product [Lathyrus sativus]